LGGGSVRLKSRVAFAPAPPIILAPDEARLGAIRIMKKAIIVILSVVFQSCVMHSVDLQVKLVNYSKNKVYVGELYDCDSCIIMKYVKLYCTHGNDTTFFPRLLNAGDSTVMRTHLYSSEKIGVINADSLGEYCNKGYSYNIANKKWVSVLETIVDRKTKTCRFVIK
jgi:hypothetical protein